MKKYISYLITSLSLTLAFPVVNLQSMLTKRMQRPSEQNRQELLQELSNTIGIHINIQGVINYEALFTYIKNLPPTDENAIKALILLEKLLEEDDDATDMDKRVKRINLEIEPKSGCNQFANPFDLR